jgi:hypothetical protein
LALRNNFRVTKKFLITKFDCRYIIALIAKTTYALAVPTITLSSSRNTLFTVFTNFRAHAKRHHQAPSGTIRHHQAPSASCRFLRRFPKCMQSLGILRGHWRPGEVKTTTKEYRQK